MLSPNVYLVLVIVGVERLSSLALERDYHMILLISTRTDSTAIKVLLFDCYSNIAAVLRRMLLLRYEEWPVWYSVWCQVAIACVVLVYIE